MHALSRSGLALAAVTLMAAGGPARATELCGWLVETVEGDNVHQFSLWLEADGDANLFYRMTGVGIVTEGMKAYSPGSGTYSLRARRPEKAWGFGATLEPPGDIDIVAEIHAPPKSVFSDEETPLLARFVFQRHVPDGEKTPPTDFAKRQCATITAGP